MIRSLASLSVAAVAAFASSAFAQTTLKVSAIPDENPTELLRKFTPLGKYLEAKTGVKVEFVVTDWKTIMNALQADQFDIAMTGTSMSVARAKSGGFSIPWGKNAFFPLVQKKNAGKFKSWDDLNNPKVTAGFNLGTTMEQFVQATLPKATARRVESPARDWQELLAGRVDFVVASLIEGAALTKQHGDLQLILQDKPKNSIPMAFLIPIDDLVWKNFIDNWITIKKQNGYFAELNKKWGIVGQD